MKWAYFFLDKQKKLSGEEELSMKLKKKKKHGTNFLSRGNNTCKIVKAKMSKIFSRSNNKNGVCGWNREQVV